MTTPAHECALLGDQPRQGAGMRHDTYAATGTEARYG